MTVSDEVRFLKESNAIEGVYDAESLVNAVVAWEYLKTQKKIFTHSILEAHGILMHGLLSEDEAGHFRRVEVTVGGRPTLKSQDVPAAIGEWRDQFEESIARGEYPIPEHVAFEKIHPFVDGNGRVGRMLFNYQLFRIAKNRTQEFSPHIFYERDKQEYYKMFR